MLIWEDYFKNAFNTVREAILILDENMKVLSANRSFFTIFKVDPANTIGYLLYDLGNGQWNIPYLRVLIEDILPKNDTVDNYEIEHNFESIGRKTMLFNACKIREKKNDPPIILLAIEDITGRKLAEEKILKLNEELELRVEKKTSQLIEAQEELVRKERLFMLGQLIGSVGHELRNPLGVMSNAIYYLKTVISGADETVGEYLDIIKSEINNSERIISDLLDFSRVKTPQIQSTTVYELIKQSLGKDMVPGEVRLHLELPETLPAINVDLLQMKQVFQTLITNAVQAMPNGGELSISARKGFREHGPEVGEEKMIPDPRWSNPDQGFIEISVTDTGEGISPENMKKLFQPLFTTKARGIGLGLIVSKNLMESNGGRLEVESELGKGTTFMVIVPVDDKGQ